MDITPEIVAALAWLRNGWDGDNSVQAIKAFQTLDNPGVFAAIDEQTGYEVSEPVDPSHTPAGYAPDGLGDRHQGLDASDEAAMSRLVRRALGKD
jgi:hypothetical protein